jgi:apolipoprotein N-acyltransferase
MPTVGFGTHVAARTAALAPAGPEARVGRGVRTMASVLPAAVLYVLACPPHAWPLLAWVVPGLLLVPARGLSPARAFVCGLAFALTVGWGVTGWALHATLAYFDSSRGLAAAFVAVVWAVYGGLPFGLLLAGYAALARRVPDGLRGPLGAWLWVVAEVLRSTLLTGMPWELLGHTQARLPMLVQIADLGGVYAVSFVMALASVSAAEALAAWRGGTCGRVAAGRLVLPAALIAATLAYGDHARRAYAAAPVGAARRTVLVVQGSVPSDFRWQRARSERAITTYARLSAAAAARPVDLIVWPENAVNLYLDREPMLLAALAPVAALARDGLLVGGPRLAADGEARNSAYLVAPAGAIIGTYDKRRLLPLAEYNPFHRASTARPSEPAYAPGNAGRPLEAASMRIGAAICYEILFPGLIRDLVRNGAELLVNVSNDSWLDDGSGAALDQHFSMAVFRAIETRRFLVRAATTGISGVVSPTGEVRTSVPRNRAGAAAAEVILRREATPYVRWGDGWVVLVGAGIGLAAWSRRPGARA